MKEHEILDLLISLCDDLAWGRPTDEKKLFSYTVPGSAPEKINKLAEAFGLMLVKVEGRDLYNTRLIEELKKQNGELEQAKAVLKRNNFHLAGVMRETLTQNTIIGQSPKMLQAIKMASDVARTPINTMLLGETGTGKEVFAKYIHFHSPRRENPFIPINCTAIPDSLFESEMFGIEKGVATGVNQRKGFFEEANGGTIFLDEIGDMNLANQAKLLRVLEEKEICRIGSSKPVSVDIKVISATNINIEKAVEEGRFREDLYYRLAVEEIFIPPLREREEDILLLAHKLLERFCKTAGRDVPRLSETVKKCFLQYAWKGNVRELANEMERLSVLCFSDTVEFFDLSKRIQNYFEESGGISEVYVSKPAPSGRDQAVGGETAAESAARDDDGFNLLKHEERLILKTLEHCGGNRSRSAKLLGITREGLRKKLMKMQAGSIE